MVWNTWVRWNGLCGLLAVVMVLCASSAWAKHADTPTKTGIVLALFGSSDPAVQSYVDAFADAVRQAHPDAVVTLAYTSARAREALRERKKPAPSVAEALASLPDKGVRRAVVQSLHVMPGREFHDMLRTGNALRGLPKGLQDIRVGYPLVGTPDTLGETAQALLESVPQRRKSDAVLFVGHGTEHVGGLAYPALQYALWEQDPNAFISVLEGVEGAERGVLSAEAALRHLKKSGVKKVYLAPLLNTAGVHMKEDIVGPEKDSWTNVLRKNGYDVVEVRRGLLESPAVREIFLKRINTALGEK